MDSRPRFPISPIVLNRQFTVTTPNRAWGSDILAYEPSKGGCRAQWGWIDFPEKGWGCAASIATTLLTRALQMAVGQRRHDTRSRTLRSIIERYVISDGTVYSDLYRSNFLDVPDCTYFPNS